MPNTLEKLSKLLKMTVSFLPTALLQPSLALASALQSGLFPALQHSLHSTAKNEHLFIQTTLLTSTSPCAVLGQGKKPHRSSLLPCSFFALVTFLQGKVQAAQAFLVLQICSEMGWNVLSFPKNHFVAL